MNVEQWPFRHVVQDNWAPQHLLRAVSATWPAADWEHWHCYDNGKRASKCPPSFLPPAADLLLKRMLDLTVADLLQVGGAFPDYALHGGGLHDMPAGSRLGIHVDAERHPIRPWQRVASAVLFCEPDWQECWGGNLELWNGPESGAVIKIEPKYGRLVLFATDMAYHGVPKPISAGAERSRKTLAAFFWRVADVDGQSAARFVN